MKKLMLIAVLALTACTDANEATKALEDSGYKNIKIEGYSFIGCSKDDAYHTEFTATGATGRQVNGVVCGGWLKGSTIRMF